MPRSLQWCHEQLILMHAHANVGHLGGNLSCLDALYHAFAQLQPQDRFILSKGHSAGALYVVLAAYDVIPSDSLSTFHRDDTKLPGHPPANSIDAIPFATGSLGHGLSLAAGFALSQRMRGTTAHTICLTSDGEWQEGSTWEALIFLCHHQLSNLTILIDNNGWQGFGATQHVASMHDLPDKLRAFPLQLMSCDGHDSAAIVAALQTPATAPRCIVLNTMKGRGLPELADTLQSHYLPPTPLHVSHALNYLHGGQ
ncbi:MAG: hypothetical protein RL076_470 [Chloroflexota bacterium]